MMNKLLSFAACCSVLLATGSGCSKKPDPTPEETALLRAGTDGGRAGFVNAGEEEPLLDGGDIEGAPLGDELVGRNIDFADLGEGDIMRNRFDAVYFGFDQYAVDPGERTKITKVADYLKQETSSRLVIEGHCDWKGTPEYNKSLGDRRATSVRQYLIDLSVPPERIDILSKGDEEAFESGSAEQMRLNRKAQFVVIR